MEGYEITCTCRICQRSKRFLSIIKTLSGEDQKFMKGVLNELVNAEFNRDWLLCKLEDIKKQG